MRKISKAFLTGLFAVLPIAITIYILYWLGGAAESVFRGLLLLALPDRFYYTGMGLVAGVVLIVLIGLSLRAWVVRRLFALGEWLFERIPVVKTVYGSVRDLISFVSDTKGKSLTQPVMVTLGGSNLRLLGFITRENFDGLPEPMGANGAVAVYLPMSYQMGGFTTLVPRSSVQPLDMSFQDALRFALTAGMLSQEKKEDSEPPSAAGNIRQP